jgi:hypothetical protein
MQKDGEEWAAGLDPISNPSAAELVHKKVTERAGVVANTKRSALEAAYGGTGADTASAAAAAADAGESSSSSSGGGGGGMTVQAASALDPRLLMGASESYRYMTLSFTHVRLKECSPQHRRID